MGNIKNSNCNICGSYNSTSIYKEKNHIYNICKKCGHVYQSCRKDKIYYHQLPYESQWDNYLEHTRNRAKYINEFCRDFLVNTCKILDVGCGPGGVLKKIQSYYPHIKMYGITSPSDKKRILKGIKVKFGDFDEIDFKNKTFDFVICSHILEHFLNPIKGVKKLSTLISKNGYVYIEVPSFYWAEIRSNPQYCPVHLSYFTIQQLKNMLGKYGFEIIKSHESKYWGNIKIIAQLTGNKIPYKTENWLTKKGKQTFLKRFAYPFYKTIKNYKNIRPND